MLKVSNLVEVRATVVQDGIMSKITWTCDSESTRNTIENFIYKYGFSMANKVDIDGLYFNNNKDCDIEFSFAFIAEVI